MVDRHVPDMRRDSGYSESRLYGCDGEELLDAENPRDATIVVSFSSSRQAEVRTFTVKLTIRSLGPSWRESLAAVEAQESYRILHLRGRCHV